MDLIYYGPLIMVWDRKDFVRANTKKEWAQ